MKKMILKIILPIFMLPLFLTCGPASEAIPAETAELSIRNILEMPAYEQIYHDIVYIGEEQKVLFIKTTDKRVLFSIDIRIQAGIKNAGLININITGKNSYGRKTAVVSLPGSEILLADADENTIEQYFIKEWGGEISRLDYYDEINRKKEELVADAIRNGILEHADANIKNLIKGFLSLSDIDVIEFREAADEN